MFIIYCHGMVQTALQDTQETASPLDILARSLNEPMARVNAIILERMTSDVPMIPQLVGYLIAAGGKRIRPLLTLACADLCGDTSENPKKMATAVEFIHTATLLHDDVIDGSEQRRGQPVANTVFGNPASILVGDFLFARAFELMVETDNIRALDILAKAASVITEGEILQMSLIGQTGMTRDQYYKIIGAKTAVLFSASCEVAPVLMNRSSADADALRQYGYAVGMVFQIIDDIMDYTSTRQDMGKKTGDDFAEGKVTLPIIIAMESATKTERDVIHQALQSRDLRNFDTLAAILHHHDAFEKSIMIAREFANTACQSIQDFDTNAALKTPMLALPEHLLNRIN